MSEGQQIPPDVQVSSQYSNAVVWVVSIFLLISSSFCLFSRLWWSVLSALTTIGIILVLICSSVTRSKYLSIFSFSCIFNYYYYYYYYYTFCVLSHKSFTGVWVITSLLMSLELFSVFWPFLTMLKFGWSRFFLWFSIPPVFFTNLWRQFPSNHQQLIYSS